MSTIILIEHDGTEHSLSYENGQSVMEVATENMVPGIDADCGGECACGTCHVFIDSQWRDQLGEINLEEAQMLDMAPEKREESRLACQVRLSADNDGMVVKLPEFQM